MPYRPQPPAGRTQPEAQDAAAQVGAGADVSANGHRRAAAFFDLDKTLMAGSSGIFFARAAYETGMISRGRLARDAYENLRFRLLGSTDERADDVRRRVGRMIAGVRVRDLQRLSPRVLAGVLPRLYPQMLARAYSHQDAGVPVYILTAASQEMADLLAHVLAFDGGLGSRSEVVEGRYTGRAAGPFNYREGKVLSMRELAQQQGIDLQASFAYSDSESDLPMLRAVGNPVVVNPDAELRRIAQSEGWEVLHLDRLGRRIKVLAALGAGAALASLGKVVRERGAAAGGGSRAAGGVLRAVGSRAQGRLTLSARPRGARRETSR
jgi:HAD superfamily hydrolase (TIGR01490 family)